MRLLAIFSVLALVAIIAVSCAEPAADFQRMSEADMIARLSSPNPADVRRALQYLGQKYPNSTNAIPRIKQLLNDPKSPEREKSARVLAVMHAPMDATDIQSVCSLLKSPNADDIASALKTLRALNTPPPMQDVLPLLHHPNHRVVGNACATLGVFGDQSAIPALEPLLQSPNPDIRSDASLAIEMLKTKPAAKDTEKPVAASPH